MHRKLKGETRKCRTSIGEYVLLLLTGVFAFMTAGELHNRGIPHKWATAIMGTLVTFGIVVYLMPPDVDPMGILGCNWHLPRSTYKRDLVFLPIRSLWRGPVQYSILVSRNACRSFCVSNCSEEDSRQVNWHARKNQVESMIRRNLAPTSERLLCLPC